MKLLLSFIILCTSSLSFAQISNVIGRVSSSQSNESIEMASVTIVELQKIVFTDKNGVFTFENIVPGLYTFKAKAAGFDEQVMNEISVTYTRKVELNFTLEPLFKEQKEVKVKASAFKKNPESPVSLRTLNAAEIERLPGAGRDVSKVLQALPGVALRPTFRNDIIIRGGSPGENKFYLDGIEVPNINHFATQGSSGGPVGLLNVNFIREVDFYSGAFPANRANGLSSVISFNQKDGNKEKLVTNFALGSSDAALTFDGPLGKKADFIFSIRRSYLQFLFSALKLPFLPTYNDSQFKVNIRPNDKNKISIIGLGAFDDFALNTSVNDGITDTTKLEYNNFILGNIPTQKQWNYTIGMNWQHYSKNSIQTIVASRNMLNNSSVRYFNNIEEPINRILDYSSFEAENKFRFEHQFTKNGYKFNLGVGYEYARYFSSNYNKIAIQGNVITIDNQSNLYMSKAAAFGQVSKAYLDGRMNLSLGIRTDINSYSSSMSNPLNQLSPMVSASYKLTPSWTINANVARYNQLPAYTILGFRNATGDLVNKQNELKYITADHFVLGTAYLTEFNARFSVEGFYKKYMNYPFSINDSISLANLGTDFGIVGNEAVRSVSTGRAYGTEFLYQQKMVKGFYGVVAYTFVTSGFLTANNTYAASSWDSKNIVSLTGGKRFKNGWEIGVRWLYSGGSPYTPIDVETSSLKAVWDVNGRGLLDYSKLNTEREGNFHQLNIRVDKKYYLKKWTLNFYLDIQNAYAAKTKVAPILLVEKDAAGNPITDPNDPTRYKTKFIENTSGILQPSLGIIIEFKH
jgi:hypothetical protein